ncbi:tyrosine-protein phosphatase 10D-like [Asterias rubens]|uniref:tyrosine-protein phosphatase 10D-like n=1 Tax=Asterias rubens TaxID=7604 RepID=UPI0014550458|nr:tyrosine-protein phosphatase 10D-like [Asterias rubens]
MELCEFTVTVDTIAPNASFANCPADVLTNDAVVTYTEPTASDGGVDLSVSCDPPSGSTFTENKNTTVFCTATDAARNEAEEFCVFLVTVDTISPNATVANCPADVLTNDAVVNYTEPTALDGGVDLSVSCDPPSGSNFAENINTAVTCTAADAAGNEAEEFCVFLVTVDTIAPNVTFANCPVDVLTNDAIVNFTEPTASDGGVDLSVSCDPPSGSNFAENTNTTVTCTATDAAGNEAEEFCVFLVTVDTIAPNATFANCPADVLTNDAVVYFTEPTASDGGVDLSVSCDPPSGSNFAENTNTTVTCTATDAAGNEAEEFCVFLVTVDTIAPNATFANCPADVLTNDAVVNYTEPTASDGGVDLQVSCDPPSGSTFAENIKTTVTCTATDAAGNEAEEFCVFLVTVDTIAPNATFANCPVDVLTNDAIVNFTEPTASDGGVDLSVSCDPPSGSNFAENTNTTVTCTATDAAGNEAEEFCVFLVTVDTIAPNATFANCPVDVLTNDAIVNFTEPTASDGGVDLSVSCDPPSGSNFAENTNTTVTCTATDAAGNEAEEFCVFLVTVDTIAPNATFANCPADVLTNDAVVNFTEPTASDGGVDLNVSCDPPSGSTFTQNNTNVTCTATDAAGNEAEEFCVFLVTVDVVLPSFTFCPDDIDGFADSGTNSTVVTWQNPTATDNLIVEGFPTVTCSPKSGSRFEIGETEVSCIASDAAGNEGDQDCNILIMVTELSAPVIVNITDVTNETMLITWTSMDEVESFTIVYVGGSGNKVPLRVNVTGEKTSHVLTELQSGETYSVTVIGEKGLALAESEPRTATTELNAPTITRTSSSQMTSLEIEWSSPPRDVVRQYSITYTGMNEDLTTVSKMKDGNSTSTMLEGLLSGETYELTVTASSGSLEGTEVSATSAKKHETTVPRNVTLEESDSTVSSVTVQWSPPTEPESTLTPVIEFYTIHCSDGQASPAKVNFTKSETTTASCVNLSNAGAVYTVTVTSHSQGKEASSSLMIIALPNGVVLKETQPTTTTSVSAMWSNPDGKADSFEIECSSGVPKPQSIPVDPTDLENVASCVDLPSPGNVYTMTVFVKSGGRKNSSTHIQLRALPESVEGLRVTDFTNSQAMISWRTPVNCANCVFTSFKAFRSDDSGEPQIIPFVTGQAEYETQFGGLVAGAEYTFTVISQSGDKEGHGSSTTQQIKPSPVTAFETPVVSATSIQVSWQDVDGVKDEYILSIQPEDGTLKKPGPLDTTAVFNDLKPVTLYTITVITRSGQQQSDPYMEEIQTDPDKADPPTDKPSNPSKPSTTSFEVELYESYFSQVNGDIQNYTVIVAQQATTIPSVPDPAATWSAAQTRTPIPPYQAFVAQAYPFPASALSTRKKRQASSPVSIQIGVGDCSPGDDVYCNGPLRDDTSYIYLFRVWNKAGYTDSPFSRPIRTANDTTLEVGLGVGIPLTILFIVFIVLLLLVIKRKRQLQRGASTTAYANEAFANDVQVPLRKRGNSRPIQLENFPEHYRSMKADSDYLFSEEYDELRPIGRDQSTEAALLDVNRSKNRFVNILPYDHSRVKLSQVDDEEGSDYINANFIPGYNSPREFIACQGPLPGTVDDMWRLVWEQRVSTIVMVTQLVEKGRVKCHRYWPVDDEPVCYGEIFVTRLSEKVLKQWTVREFELQKGEKSRKLRHFNFTAWPDHGVPESSEGILRFVRNVRNQIPKNRRPTIVHCSAGVGRTGTFLSLDRISQHLKENEFVDVFGITSEMRMHRNYMVQTEKQYIFIHDCIMHLLQGRSTNGEAHYENRV